MEARKSQGSYFGLFLVGATVLCGGIAYFGSVTGKLLLLVGAGILLAALAGFLKIKPLEGENPLQPSSEAMKWIGAGAAALGWVVTLGGLHFVDGNGGGITPPLVGLGGGRLRERYSLPSPLYTAALLWRPARAPTPARRRPPRAQAAPTLADAGNQIGQNKVAINFVWTLVCGFLVMFMQAGFAMVESGLTRVKNANHTYMMNFFVYGCGLLAYWVIGFAIQMGGAAGNANLGGLQPLASEHSVSLFGKAWRIFGGS